MCSLCHPQAFIPLFTHKEQAHHPLFPIKSVAVGDAEEKARVFYVELMRLESEENKCVFKSNEDDSLVTQSMRAEKAS